MTGKSTETPKFWLMFLIHAMCAGTESTERPISCTLRFLNSSERLANSTNSVVQTGVKSAGCEKRTTHLPLKSESFNCPCVDLASKSGAGSLILGIVGDLSSDCAGVLICFLFLSRKVLVENFNGRPVESGHEVKLKIFSGNL